MKRKLYIINNGLKDYRGHYFESGIAIAEAAQGVGLLPILGVHKTCPPDLTPSWIETHCLFRTDHWMTTPAERNDASHEVEEESHPARQPHSLVAAGKTLVRNLLPPLAHRFLQRLIRNESSQVSDTGPSPLGPLTREQMLEGYLVQAGFPHEYDYSRWFQEDLTSLLVLTDCRPEDVVFLPTAHGRELLAIHRLVADLGPGRCPSFHLQYRHDMELQPPASDPGPEYGYRTLHRIFFYFAGLIPDHERIRLFADTKELGQDFQHFSQRRFGVLPIPFRSRLIGSCRRHDSNSTLSLGFFGDVREEKGFHLLPEVVRCMESHRGRVNFLIQASYANSYWEVKCRGALAKLRRFPADYVRLIGVNGPLSDEEYYRRFAEVDILLCPYDAYAYRFRSSGVMAEALAAGIPTVVPARTWLAGQQPPGAGVIFEDLPSLLAGVRSLCDDYSRYESRAGEFAPTWLATHTPLNLVQALLKESAKFNEAYIDGGQNTKPAQDGPNDGPIRKNRELYCSGKIGRLG